MASPWQWSDRERLLLPCVTSEQGVRLVFCDDQSCSLLWRGGEEERDGFWISECGIDLHACMHCWHCGRQICHVVPCARHHPDECPLEDFWVTQDAVDVARTLLPNGRPAQVGMPILLIAEDLWLYDAAYRRRPQTLCRDAVKTWRENYT